MHNLSEINPHLALAQSESYESPGDRAWVRFVARVEKRIGCDLDGDEDRDGFSIDAAYGAFEAGETAAEYALDVQVNLAKKAVV